MTEQQSDPHRTGIARLWHDATATTGARTATIVALVLAGLLVVGGVGAVAVALVASHHDGMLSTQVVKRLGPGGRPDGGAGAHNGPGFGRADPGGVPGGHNGPGLGGLGGVLHGEVTTATGVLLVQQGSVTASSSSSISVKSSDGFTATYAVTGQTRVLGSPKAGDSVLVLADKNGAKATRVTVR